ncbi:putative phage major capsid protein E [Escherichia coli BCE034_MS-14]|nr:putative phage major capsid protein E [Escherichia coli BCE034_MS-14]
MQAVSAVLKGKYTMTGEVFDPVEVDMGRSGRTTSRSPADGVEQA